MKKVILFASFCLFIGSLISCGSSGTKEPEATSTAADTATVSDGFVSIFDGVTFKDWDGDTSYWHVQNGAMTAEITPEHQLKANTFMIWRGGTPSDFEFKAEYRISPEGNSGVQYRSEELPDIKYALKGYQADIDGANVYTGQNYEERGRGFLAMRGQIATIPVNGKPIIDGSLGNPDSLKTLIKPDWNEIHLVVQGNHMKHYINGTLMSETTDNDTINRKSSGVIGLQLHVMPKMKVEYRNVRLKQ